MKSLFWLFILVISFSVSFFGLSTSAQQERPKDIEVEDYVVEYGDTLQGIATKNLSDPKAWKKLKEQNRAIKNPNRIYPGDTLSHSDGWRKKQLRGTTSKLAKPWYGLPIEKPIPARPFEPPPLIVSNPNLIEAAGFLVPERVLDLKRKEVAKIINSEEGRLALTFSDLVYTDRGTAHGVKPGDILVAYRPEREVFNPVTSRFEGTLIKILGQIKVSCLEEKISCTEIVKSYDYMQEGDQLMPATELSIPYAKLPRGDSKTCCLITGGELQAVILTEQWDKLGILANDVVYINVGTTQGVQPADQFIIYRKIGEGYPKRALGRLVVLSVQDTTATAMVTESLKMIEPGERVTLKR
jgi:hypothetical protein